MIPTTLVTGALGVGKTTGILGLLRDRPAGGRWAVLVNEFGRVGIDGAVLDVGGLEVREIAGGCICCTANVPLRTALVRLVREVRPERLIVEPTGLAHPASVIDVVRSPGLREALSLRATITVVDVRRLRPADPLWSDQVRAADVLVGSWVDLASAPEIEAFHAFAAALYPPPVVVATTDHARLDPRWLDLDPSPRGVLSVPPSDPGAAELGWIWPPERVFRAGPLQELVQTLARPGELLPSGLLRLKGVFRTERGWLLVQATADTVRFEPIGWRRDSRVSLIHAGPAPDADALRRAFEALG